MGDYILPARRSRDSGTVNRAFGSVQCVRNHKAPQWLHPPSRCRAQTQGLLHIQQSLMISVVPFTFSYGNSEMIVLDIYLTDCQCAVGKHWDMYDISYKQYLLDLNGRKKMT